MVPSGLCWELACQGAGKASSKSCLISSNRFIRTPDRVLWYRFCYTISMTEMLPFFIVLFAGVFFSSIFNRLHLPWVVALILGGIIIGPDGFNLFTPNSTIIFLSEIGLVFLMFMAGLETKLGHFSDDRNGAVSIALLNGLIPAALGFAVGYLFGFDFNEALLLAIVFISSSIAVVIPTLERHGTLHTRLWQMIVSTTMLQDIASLVLVSMVLQTTTPLSAIPLPLFYLLLYFVIRFLRFAIPKLLLLFESKKGDIFQQEIRSIFVLLIGTVILFEIIGLHPIVGGFFVGFVLSDVISSKRIKEKIRAISYGLFIPTFFIMVGVQADMGVLFEGRTVLFLAAVITIVSMGSKFLSGYLGGKLFKFSNAESALIGASSIPQLSTTLAIVITGQEIGMLSQETATALVVLTIFSTLISPTLMSRFYKKIDATPEVMN